MESSTWNPANTNSWLDVPYRSSPQLHLLKTRCYDALALGDNSIAGCCLGRYIGSNEIFRAPTKSLLCPAALRLGRIVLSLLSSGCGPWHGFARLLRQHRQSGLEPEKRGYVAVTIIAALNYRIISKAKSIAAPIGGTPVGSSHTSLRRARVKIRLGLKRWWITTAVVVRLVQRPCPAVRANRIEVFRIAWIGPPMPVVVLKPAPATKYC